MHVSCIVVCDSLVLVRKFGCAVALWLTLIAVAVHFSQWPSRRLSVMLVEQGLETLRRRSPVELMAASDLQKNAKSCADNLQSILSDSEWTF